MKKLITLWFCILFCSLFFLTIKVQGALPQLNKSKIVMNPDTKYTLKLNGAELSKVIWASSDSRVVTVTSKGMIMAKTNGTAKIRATYKNKKYFCSVRVESPKLNQNTITVRIGESFQLKVIGSWYSPAWASSDNTIVTVDQKGIATAKEEGIAKIRATVGKKKLYCTVKVVLPEISLPSVPDFPWGNYNIIAHALGSADGMVYLNSRESFIESYDKGYRMFEADLSQTSDGVWVCRHNWKEALGQWEGGGKRVLSCTEFLFAPIYGKYTPMTLADLFLLLKEYPDAYVMLDSKEYETRNYSNTLEDYQEYIRIAKNCGAEESLNRIIPQIYNESMYPAVASLKKFPTYLYAMWQDYSEVELTCIADYCQKQGIDAVTISRTNWSSQIQQIFDERDIYVYVYTVNNIFEAQKYLLGGAHGICSDVLI